MILYAIIDKTRSPHPTSASLSHAPSQVNFAGVLGYLNSCPIHLKTEIGFLIVLPPFQRTHVTTNAVGLLLLYALNLPSISDSVPFPGLGLRRVQWQTNELNAKSIRAAERMGLKMEGILRWDRVLPANPLMGSSHEQTTSNLGWGVDIQRFCRYAGTIGRTEEEKKYCE